MVPAVPKIPRGGFCAKLQWFKYTVILSIVTIPAILLSMIVYSIIGIDHLAHLIGRRYRKKKAIKPIIPNSNKTKER